VHFEGDSDACGWASWREAHAPLLPADFWTEEAEARRIANWQGTSRRRGPARRR
jgi:hypothetical protein